MNDVRKKMLKWERVGFCSSCDKNYGSYKSSRREDYNYRYAKYIPDILKNSCIETWNTKQKIIYMDLRLSNVCNLSCRMCFSESSTSRREIDRLLGKKVYDVVDDTWEFSNIIANIDYVEELYFAWWEPLLDKNFERLIDIIAQKGIQKNITLRINTNLVLLTDELLKKIKKFKKVFFIVSCDWYEKKYEYIRIGAKWNAFVKNLVKVAKNVHDMNNWSTVCVVAVAQITNLYSLFDLYKLCKKLRIAFSYNILEFPKNMNIGILDKEEKAKIIAFYKVNTKWDEAAIEKFDMLIQYLNSSTYDQKLFQSYLNETKIIDKHFWLEKR